MALAVVGLEHTDAVGQAAETDEIVQFLQDEETLRVEHGVRVGRFVAHGNGLLGGPSWLSLVVAYADYHFGVLGRCQHVVIVTCE